MLTHTLGFPRIGPNRELKKAVEGYWSGRIDRKALMDVGRAVRLDNWTRQKAAGIDLVPVGDFSFYDHVLDLAALLGCPPPRHGRQGEPVDLDASFRMARGEPGGPDAVTAMEMTKWYDTNYHYIVPEFSPATTFTPSTANLFEQLDEAASAGFAAKPVLPGPFTFLSLGKSVQSDFDKWTLLEKLVRAYEDILSQLSRRAAFIQLDEPILATDLPRPAATRFADVQARLSEAASPATIILTAYFGGLDHNLDILRTARPRALHLDLVRAPGQLDAVLAALPEETILSLGLINGRNVWRADMEQALGLVMRAREKRPPERLMLAPSCSLLHVPVDLAAEEALDPEIASWLAFATQKCAEVAALAEAATSGDPRRLLMDSEAYSRSRAGSRAAVDPAVRERLAGVTADMTRRASPYPERAQSQARRLRLPKPPTTTIGSFPQTAEVRATRRRHASGELSREDYETAMKAYIDDCLALQESLGLDVLVHGEPERADMVEYFGQMLSGFTLTGNGWVQSYGSRCVKPPIIHGDVSRPGPMTVAWFAHAQSRTAKPVKGMLTGPTTILCWSFVRDDQPLALTCRQIALAVRDEVADLERAGAAIIQIDEPALREGLPLRRQDWDAYLDWAVGAFRLASSGVSDATQIHTHMCYAEFNEIIDWIARLDADVLSIEASRSNMELLSAFARFDYPNEVGPGVWDIHSPRAPSTEEMAGLSRKALRVLPRERLWVNPDCGLKTRDWPETKIALANMVAAARLLREEGADG